MKLFIPLWHPPEPVPAGGLYRTRRILEEWRDAQCYVVDSDTTDLRSERIGGTLRRYPARSLYASRSPWFALLRMLNYAWSCVALTALGLFRRDLAAVYVPTSELPHAALAGFVVGKLRRLPIVFANLNVQGTILWALNRELHKRVDAVIALSHALKDELRAEGISVPIHVGTVGVDDHSSTRNPQPLYDGIFVGRHTEEKGIFDLIDIWSRVNSARPGARMVTLGACTDAMRAELQRRLERLGLRDRVDIIGVVDERQKWSYYANSRVCVFPSRVEGWGIVPLEAYFAGIPVVAYDLGAYAETIRGSAGADLIAMGDIDAFSVAILRRLAGTGPDGAELKAYAAAFTWEKAARLERDIVAQYVRQS